VLYNTAPITVSIGYRTVNLRNAVYYGGTYTPPKIMARIPPKISSLLISPCYITPKHEIKISNTDENLAKHLSILVIYLKFNIS
jgi:hypothetical protein